DLVGSRAHPWRRPMLRRFAMVTALLACAAALPACPSPPPVATPPATPTAPAKAPAAALAELEQRDLDGLLVAKPHLAPHMGDHPFDGRHADLSTKKFARHRAELAAQRAALEAIPRDGLGADERVDADIVRDGIDLELLYIEEIREQE